MKIQVFSVICLLAFLLSPLSTRAMAISPSVIDLSSNRGEIVNSSFTIFNSGASEQTYFFDLLAFESNNEDGTPVFTQENIDHDVLLSWIDIAVPEVIVPAYSRIEIPFTIVVPDDIASGSYYGAISVSTAPSDIVSTNGATIEAKVAILIFLKVEGNTIEQLELLDFTGNKSFSSLPFGNFQFRLQNQGNVYLIPNGRMTIKGLFGQTIASMDVNVDKGRILPLSTRTYEVMFEGDSTWLSAASYQLRHLIVGPISVSLDLEYGDIGTIETQTVIWMFPWQLLSLLAIVGLTTIIFYKKIQK